MFIAIDGGDGGGKTTQIAELKSRLEQDGYTVSLFREPGSTELGESIRGILLQSREMSICSRSELFLFMSARCQLLEEKIRPALHRGEIVLVDRFLLSTIVYQGKAGGIPTSEIWSIGKIALGNCYPDLTILLDIDPATAEKRMNRPLDRIERKGREFHEKVRSGFRNAAEESQHYFTGRCVLIDADSDQETVAEKIYQLVKELL